MTDRIVRFSDAFFDSLEALLPPERGEDGTPSVHDFLVLELPSIRHRLARDVEDATLPTDDPELRVYIGAGVLVPVIAVFVVVGDDAVDVVWAAFDRGPA